MIYLNCGERYEFMIDQRSGEERCVTTLITAAKDTIQNQDCQTKHLILLTVLLGFCRCPIQSFRKPQTVILLLEIVFTVAAPPPLLISCLLDVY